MSTLSELQQALGELMQSRRGLVTHPGAQNIAARYIAANPRLSPVEQLEIYREQFWLRHTNSLLEDFPGLSGIIGQAAWERLVEGYLESHPPQAFSLRDLGARLPEFVAQQDWLEQQALCVDMARLEWAYIECFDAADSPRLDPSELGAIPPEAWASARFQLAESLRLLKTGYPVAALRRQLRANPPGGSVPLPAPEPQNLAIFRQNRDLRHQQLPMPGFVLLSHLAAGLSLSNSLEEVVSRGHLAPSEVPACLERWFREWAQLGWIAHVIT